MNILDANIGSARDNMSSPVHNWYKFTAGFSYKFVDIILEDFEGCNPLVFDPFAGCGTTLVECQKLRVHSIGNESQELMCNVINAKLNWNITQDDKDYGLSIINLFLKRTLNASDYTGMIHPLLATLYDYHSLRELYCIRDAIRSIGNQELQLFLNLALSQTLHKSALHPIAVPYISRSKNMTNPGHVWEKFLSATNQMLLDIEAMPHKEKMAKVFNTDSRCKNIAIADASCNLCITSPPYLNNLDYGEVSKVHSHFFEMTTNWNDITEKVRHNLVTGATTHYKDASFKMEEFVQTEFAQRNPDIMEALQLLFEQIKENAKTRKGKKSFHILMMYYFEDMYKVLKEMRRVLSEGAEAYLILGDSAPYGVYIPTTQILGDISLSVGFSEYRIHKIRSRGNKWRGLSNRHNISLSENILVLH